MENIIVGHEDEIDFAEYMIVCGRFELQLCDNLQGASKWLDKFIKSKVSPLHYAPWLQGYLLELEDALARSADRIER